MNLECTCTFRRLMNCTHSSQVVRNGSKHTAHLPNRESIVCISRRSSKAVDSTDDLFKCSFRMNLAACSWAENNVISCQSTHLFNSYFFLSPASDWIVIITTCIFSLDSLYLISQCIYSFVLLRLYSTSELCPSFSLLAFIFTALQVISNIFWFWPLPVRFG